MPIDIATEIQSRNGATGEVMGFRRLRQLLAATSWTACAWWLLLLRPRPVLPRVLPDGLETIYFTPLVEWDPRKEEHVWDGKRRGEGDAGGEWGSYHVVS